MRMRIAVIISCLAVLAGCIFYLAGHRAAHLADEDSRLEQLRALPYIAWSKDDADASQSGVRVYDPAKASPGYNLYTDDAENAFIMDMQGRIVYQWRFPSINGDWELAELLDNGVIVALCVGKCFAKIDRDSKVIWINNIPAHHDIVALKDGSLLVVVYQPNVLYKFRNVKFDAMLRLDPDGKVLEGWDTFKNLKQLQKIHAPQFLDFAPKDKTRKALVRTYMALRNIGRDRALPCDAPYLEGNEEPFLKRCVRKLDAAVRSKIGLNEHEYYHLNTIKTLPENSLGERDRRFRPGNYLTCLRNCNTLVILDRDSKKITWSWGQGVLDWPHMPTMLETGTILVFDNGIHRGYSRILEVEPLNGRIVWEYRANPEQSFFSEDRGSCQRLPNGNTLITESTKGRVFEITKEKEIVWEFYNPRIKDGKRKLIYRMMRIPQERVDSWLKPS